MKFKFFLFVLIATFSNTSYADEHWLSVQSNSTSAVSYLDPIMNADQSGISGMVMTTGNDKTNFSLDQLKNGSVLKTQSGQKVVQIQVANDFSEKNGGAAKITLLHKFNLLSKSDFRVIHVDLINGPKGWEIYFDSKNGKELFNDLYFTTGSAGINSVDFKMGATTVDSESLDDLPQQ